MLINILSSFPQYFKLKISIRLSVSALGQCKVREDKIILITRTFIRYNSTHEWHDHEHHQVESMLYCARAQCVSIRLFTGLFTFVQTLFWWTRNLVSDLAPNLHALNQEILDMRLGTLRTIQFTYFHNNLPRQYPYLQTRHEIPKSRQKQGRQILLNAPSCNNSSISLWII